MYSVNHLDQIIQDLSPTPNPKSELLCKVVHELVDFYINWEVAALTGTMEGLGQLRNQLVAVVKSSQHFIELELDFLAGAEKSGQSVGDTPPWFTVSQSYTKGQCSIFFQDYNIDKVRRGAS
jgi:hypothetical protein